GQGIGREAPPRGEHGQEPTLLVVVPGQLEAERAQLLDGEDEAARRAHLRDLLDRDERLERTRPDTAVLLVGERPEDPVLAEELDDVPGELGRLVDLGGPRRDPFPGERPHQVSYLALLRRHPFVQPFVKPTAGGADIRNVVELAIMGATAVVMAVFALVALFAFVGAR